MRLNKQRKARQDGTDKQLERGRLQYARARHVSKLVKWLIMTNSVQIYLKFCGYNSCVGF